MDSSNTITVIAGLIVKNGRALLTQRRADKDCPFLWETPGGKQQGDESFHATLRRELREELGIEVGAIPESAIVWTTVEPGVEVAVRCHVGAYLVQEWTGEPRPLEGQGMGWFTATELVGANLAPANRAERWALHQALSRVSHRA